MIIRLSYHKLHLNWVLLKLYQIRRKIRSYILVNISHDVLLGNVSKKEQRIIVIPNIDGAILHEYDIILSLIIKMEEIIVSLFLPREALVKGPSSEV